MRSAFAILVAAGCAAASDPVELHGSGTTNPSRFFWEAMELIEARTKQLVLLSYRAVGSSTGQREFVCDPEDLPKSSCNFSALTDFGAGDIPMNATRYDALKKASREMLHIPFALGAIGVFHSVPSADLGDDGSLSLDACLLARIFSGDITRWDHEDIAAANPELVAAADIKVVHRVRGSSSTAGFTEYLTQKCPDSWTLSAGSTIDWPVGEGREGSGGMSEYIKETAYAIGYIDAGHGHDSGLAEVELQNLNGVYLSSKDADIGAAADVALKAGSIPAASEDWSAVNLYDLPGNNTWPITMVSYFYVDKDIGSKNPETAALLIAFVKFILSPEGQALAEENLFDQLPSDLVAFSQEALNQVLLPAEFPVYTFETSTRPGLGQDEYVISSKRSSFATYERALIEQDVNELKTQVAAISAHETHETRVMHGSGTTNPSRLFWEAMELIEARTKGEVELSYRAVGSSTGQREFVCDPAEINGSLCNFEALTDFGAGDIPMTATRYDALKNASREMLHIPFALGAIGVFHSVPSADLGDDGSLSLDACLLARIFSGDITRWDHEDIAAENPELVAAADIQVVHRVRGSSSTAGFTEYLTQKCPDSWTLSAGSTIDWPVGEGREGSGGMSEYIKETAYAIGYIDAGHGHDSGLAEVELQNLNGVYLSSKDADIGAAADVALKAGSIPAASEDWSAVNLYDLPGNNTWPITMVSYFYVDKDMGSKNPETAALLIAFVKFILSPEGQALAEENLFDQLPSDLVAFSQEALNQVLLPAEFPVYTFETSTRPGLGQGEYVISSKRSSFATYERALIEEELSALKVSVSNVADVRLAEVEQQLADLKENYDKLKSDINDAKDDSIAIAALVLACIALFIALVLLICTIPRVMKPITNSRTRTNSECGMEQGAQPNRFGA